MIILKLKLRNGEEEFYMTQQLYVHKLIQIKKPLKELLKLKKVEIKNHIL